MSPVKPRTSHYPALDPPPRLLMGPGPINAYPRVLQAMSTQLIGQYDPVMTQYMNETMALYREVFITDNQATVLVDGTSRAGIEAILISVIRPGDSVLILVMGRFGLLLCEIAERAGAEVHRLDCPWGEVFRPEQLEAAIQQYRPRLLATVQGDTSTTMLQPLAEIGAVCQQYDVLFYCDATASVVGNALPVDAWQLDAVSIGLQKCLGGPSGSAPITLSPRFVEAIRKRQKVEAGIQQPGQLRGSEPAIASNYFDLPMILDYWSEARLNHHTEATSMLFCARECARLTLEEGLPQVIQRHQLHGEIMAAALQVMGLQLFGDQNSKMSNIVGVYIPEGIDGERLRSQMLLQFDIEIGTSFGPLHGKIWRIGTMGYNARQSAVLTTLAALENCLRAQGFQPVRQHAGHAVAYALECYSSHMHSMQPDIL